MSFRRFFLVRLGWGLLGLWLGLTVVFVILYVVPKDPARIGVGPNVSRQAVGPTRDLGYDEPIAEQYVRFFGRVFARDSERTALTGEDADELALRTLPATFSLLGAGLLVWLGVGIGGGLLAARWNRRWPGRPLLYLAVSAPVLWLGIWIPYLLGYKLGWISPGYCEFFNPPDDNPCGGAVDWARNLVIPGLVLGLFFGAIYARMVARIVRIPGESGKRKALVVARLLGRDFGYALGAAVLIEVIFGIPGLGNTTVRALDASETRVVEATLFLAFVIAISWHFLVDIVAGALDKRLRSEWPVAAIGGRA